MALIDIAPTTTMEEVLRAYPSAKVGLFQRYHIGGCFASLHISPRDLVSALRASEWLTLLDVRKREEYDAGNLHGSRLVTVAGTPRSVVRPSPRAWKS